MTRSCWVLLAMCGVAAAGCEPPLIPLPLDGGADGGHPPGADAGLVDAGAVDAGTMDAGAPDAGEVDGGTGPMDAGLGVLGAACADARACLGVDGGVVACVAGRCSLARCASGLARDLDGRGCSRCFPKEVRPRLRATWDALKPTLTTGLAATGVATQALYDVQIFTHALLLALTECDGEDAWLDELVTLLNTAFTTLQPLDAGERWGPPSAEPMLDAAQFSFELATAMERVAAIPPARRTPAMRTLLARAPWLWRDMYARWLFRTPTHYGHGWGCIGGKPLVHTDALTLAAWVKTTGAGVVAYANGAPFGLEVSGGRLAGRLVTTAPSLGRPYTAHDFTSPAHVADGGWHAVALTFDAAAGQAKLFVDGARVHVEVTAAPLQHASSGRIHVGAYDYDVGVYGRLAGTVDDVQLYGRALSEAEVAALASCRAGPTCVGGGVVARWPLDDAAGDDVIGVSALEYVPRATEAGADGRPRGAARFNGTSDGAATKEWHQPHPHADWLFALRHDLIRDEPSDPRYCAALTDLDLQLAAGVAEVLGALERVDAGSAVTATERAAVGRYFDDFDALFAGRIARTSVRTWDGGAAVAAVLDPGSFAEHPEMEFSAYEGATYPTTAQRAAAPSATMDVSHARRFVTVFESLNRHRHLTGRAEPSDETIRQFANQLAYRLFEGNLARPRVRNFFDGANGWYRVGYSGRAGFGYQPWDFTSSAANGAYGRWARWNADVGELNRALFTVASSTEPAVVSWRTDAWGAFWLNGARRPLSATSWQYEWLMFLPSFALAP